MGIRIRSKEERVYVASEHDIEGSLDEVIQKLIKKKAELEKDYIELRIEIETEYGYYDDSWNNIVIYGRKKVSIEEFVKGNKQCVRVD